MTRFYAWPWRSECGRWGCLFGKERGDATTLLFGADTVLFAEVVALTVK